MLGSLHVRYLLIRVFLQIRIKDQPQLDVNCRHLKQYNEKMYHQLIAYPQEVIMMFDKAVTELFYETYPNDKLSHPIQVRPYNLHNASLMRLLNPEGGYHGSSVSQIISQEPQPSNILFWHIAPCTCALLGLKCLFRGLQLMMIYPCARLIRWIIYT